MSAEPEHPHSGAQSGARFSLIGAMLGNALRTLRKGLLGNIGVGVISWVCLVGISLGGSVGGGTLGMVLGVFWLSLMVASFVGGVRVGLDASGQTRFVVMIKADEARWFASFLLTTLAGLLILVLSLVPAWAFQIGLIILGGGEPGDWGKGSARVNELIGPGGRLATTALLVIGLAFFFWSSAKLSLGPIGAIAEQRVLALSAWVASRQQGWQVLAGLSLCLLVPFALFGWFMQSTQPYDFMMEAVQLSAFALLLPASLQLSAGALATAWLRRTPARPNR